MKLEILNGNCHFFDHKTKLSMSRCILEISQALLLLCILLNNLVSSVNIKT